MNKIYFMKQELFYQLYIGIIFVQQKIKELIEENKGKVTGVLTMYNSAYDDAVILSAGKSNKEYAENLFSALYEFDELDQLEHAYAVTIHKSQGSEFDYVILPLYVSYPKLFTRNLLYTAMTRAKKMLIIVGSKKVINFMVDNVESKNRKTGLKEKLIEKVK